jgi:predicted permease
MAATLAMAFAWATAAALEGTVVMQGLPPLDRAQLDLRVLTYAIALSVVVACVAGVLPASSLSRINVSSALHEAGRSQTGGRRRLRHALTTTQVAVSLVLMLGAALLTRSMISRLAIDPGFDPSSVLTFSVEPGLQNYAGPRRETFYRDLLDQVRAVPGVRAAGLAWLQPFSQGAGDTSFYLEEASAEERVSAEYNAVSSGFFAALGLPIVEGRDFSRDEFQRPDDAGGGVVIVTESLARRLAGAVPVVGRRIVMFPEKRVRTIVGVVRDTRQRRVATVSTDVLFEPFGQSFATGWASVLVGLSGASAAVASEIPRRVAAIDPTLPIYDLERLDRSFRKQFADDILIVQLTVVFSVLAMALAAVGLHGVLARTVADRRREFGIRAALGATPGGLAGLVSREAAAVLIAGAVLGLGTGWWLVRFIEARLFGIAPLDPASILIALLLVSAVTLASSLPAARRAARLDAAALLK